ncbi:MAG: hypothetical protein L0I24_07860 [Pseudonocardia sp.]|nr:hypothetical protein [Pseudonocardia sp.]
MSDTTVTTMSGRERALLRAVAAGRCQFRGGCEPVLLVDGMACTDWSVARTLVESGFVEAPDPRVPLAPARLTETGQAATLSV